ncbi:MAG: hypothetical protein IPM36_09830 [Lewinellaceae bacterium]|nr:hypothetical protein [Lewinellaceae bacterium]
MRQSPVITALLLLFTTSVSHAQFFQVIVTGPNQVSPCQAANFTVTVNNIAPVAQPAGTLTYNFSQGAGFETVLGNPDVHLVDSTDRQHPVLGLPAIGANKSITFEIQARYSCASDPGGVTDTVVLHLGGQHYVFGAYPYNIQVPAVLLTPGSNWNYSGAPGTVFTRTFTLHNSGIGDALRLYFIDNPAEAGLDLLSTTGVRKGDTIVLAGADFGPDGLLQQGESVTVTQQLRILGCDGGAQTVLFGWGCADGTVCEVDFETYQLAVVPVTAPKLELQLMQTVPVPKPCEPAAVVVRVRNTGDAPALNVSLETGFSYSPLSYTNWDKNDCFPLSAFRIDTMMVANGSPGSSVPYVVSFGSFPVDPDGPGGLSDADGDGMFDDLAPGASLQFSYLLNFNPGCMSCNGYVYSKYLGVRAKFSAACGPQQTALLSSAIDPGIAVSSTKITDNNPTSFQEDAIHNFRYGLSLSLSGLPDVCANDSFYVVFKLPSIVEPAPGFQPTMNGFAVPFQMLSNNSLAVYIPGFSGNLELPLLINCPPDPADGPCSKPNLPGRYQIRADLYWNCGNGCPAALHLACLNGVPFTVDCQFSPPGPDTLRAVTADGFTAKRMNLGYLDNTLTQQVPPNIPGINLEIGMPYDTVLLQVNGTVDGGINDIFDTTTLRLIYWNGSFQPYFNFINAKITYTDAETGKTIQCPLQMPGNSTQNGYQIRRFPLLPLVQPGGCLYAQNIRITPGDYFTIECLTVLTEALPTGPVQKIETFNADFEYQYNGLPTVCGSENTFFELINPIPDWGYYVDFPDTLCSTGVLTLRMAHGISQLSTDPFPQEIRSNNVYEFLNFELPAGIEYAANSARWIYFKGDGAGQQPVPDTLICQARNYIYRQPAVSDF